MSASTIHTTTVPVSAGLLTITIKVSLFELSAHERSVLFEVVDKLNELAVKTPSTAPEMKP